MLSFEAALWSGELSCVIRKPLSAFCPHCGARRGPPHLVHDIINDSWLHQWDNPCGHVDTRESVLAEIACQCRETSCVLLFSEKFYPFCSRECAVTVFHQSAHDMSRVTADVLAVLSSAHEAARALGEEMLAEYVFERMQGWSEWSGRGAFEL